MKRLHGYKCGIVALMLLTLGACSDEANLSPDAPQMNQTENASECVLVAKDFQWEGDASRSSLTVDGGVAKFSWTPSDRVGILPDAGAQVFFEIPQPEEGDEPLTDEERRKATFDGGAWALKATSNYAAYYPFIKDYDLNREKVPVDYTGQKQTGINTNHLGAYDYLGARPQTTNASGGVNFTFDHVGALVLLRFNVPEAGTALKNVTMSADGVTFTTKGTYDLTANGAFTITPASEGGTSPSLNVEVDYTTKADNEEVTVYFMAAPVNLSGKKVNVAVAYDEGADVLSFEADGKELKAGYGHLLEAEKPLDIEFVYDTSKAAATLTIEEGDMDIVKAVEKAFENESIQYLVIDGTLTESQQITFAEALKGKNIVLCLPKILEKDLIDALNDDKDDITVYSPFSDASKASKGDVALVDGTFVSNDYLWIIKNYLEPAGVVFWTTADTDLTDETRRTPATLTYDVVMNTDYPTCTHGLIVALKDFSQTMPWQNVFAYPVIDYQNNIFEAVNKNDYKPIISKSSLTDADEGYANYILGYQNTKLLKAYNRYCMDNDYTDYIVWPVYYLADFEKDNPAPFYTTGWFVPSPKELSLLCGGDEDNVIHGAHTLVTSRAINVVLNELLSENVSIDLLDTKGDNYFWSSTEYKDIGDWDCAIAINFNNNGMGNFSKTINEYGVRAVCAF